MIVLNLSPQIIVKFYESCFIYAHRYLDNVSSNPNDERYRKISEHNKAFQDKVAIIEGAKDFLQAVGFMPKRLQYLGIV